MSNLYPTYAFTPPRWVPVRLLLLFINQPSFSFTLAYSIWLSYLVLIAPTVAVPSKEHMVIILVISAVLLLLIFLIGKGSIRTKVKSIDKLLR